MTSLAATSSATPSCFENVDGPLFRRQRLLLDSWAHAKGSWLSDEQQDLIDGLIHFLDAIADELHDQHGVDCLLTNGLQDDTLGR